MNGRRAAQLAALLASATFLVSGCGEADDDRETGKGTAPDLITDATHVQVFRNADDVPNVVRFCADGVGFWSTLSGGDTTTKTPQLVRAPELDHPWCGAAEG